MTIQGRGMDQPSRAGEKQGIRKAAEGGLSWIVISNSFLLVQI